MIGELLAGFKKGNSERRNREILDRFLDVPTVSLIPLDEETGDRYAVIIDYMRREGAPIPTNDLWIATSAMQHGLVLINSDRHFLKLPQVATKFAGDV